MRAPYLIQRLNKPYLGEPKTPIEIMCKFGLAATGLSSEVKKILSEVCVFDYMGSSEYEFGEVPRALSAMAKNHKKLRSFLMTCKYEHKSWREKETKEGLREIYVICEINDYSEVSSYIGSMAKGKEDCKEMTRFASSLAENEYDKKTEGWLDLTNHFMFFKDKNMFENFKVLLDVKK